MALSKLATDISDKFLKCSICFEDYTEPKVLPCLHFFCKHCLIGYVTKLQEEEVRKTFPCPMCRREVDIPKDGIGDLPKMIFVDNLLHYIAGQQSLLSDEKICDSCEVNTAHLLCDQCDQALCDECRKVHDRLKLTRSHNVGTFAEIKGRRENAKIGGPVFCEKHPDKELEFYCKTDNEPICLNCKLTSHEGHRCIDIGDASKEGVARLKTMADDFGSKLESLKEKRAQLLERKTDWIDQKKATEGMARAQADQLIQAIENTYQEAMKEIQSKFEQEKKQLDVFDDSLETQINAAVNSYDLVTQLIQHGRPADIVQLVTRLEEGASGKETHGHQPAKVKMMFRSGQVTATDVKKMFGGVILRQLQAREYRKIQSISSFDAKPHAKPTIPVIVTVNFVTGLLTLENDDILLCTFASKSLRKYDKTGQLQQEFCPDPGYELQYPYAITHLHDGTIAVADNDAGNLKVFTKDGVFIKTMLDGKVEKPYGLAVNSKGLLIVSEHEPYKVRIFDKNDTLLFTLKENFRGICNVALNVNDNIIVSDLEAHCVTVFDSSGTLLFTYGTEGSGDKQLKCPRGVCTDHHGNIFITDTGNDRIHFIEADGNFKRYVATRNDELRRPRVVSLNSHGDLVVGQEDEMVKIIKFEE